jgi:uncharacterized membrane protein YcaP (DUF421 family)
MPEYLLILIRSFLSFVVLFAMTRLVGKRQIAQLSFFDYVVGISIGSIAASVSVDPNIKLMNGMVGLLVWAILPMTIFYFNLKSYKFRGLSNGSPSVVIKDGRILERNLKKERISVDELMLLLRKKNIFKLSEVEFAILETNGELSVMKKCDSQDKNSRSVTSKILKMMKEESRIVVKNGVVVDEVLEMNGYDRQWLLAELKKRGVQDVKDVFLAQLQEDGKLYIDFYEDQ